MISVRELFFSYPNGIPVLKKINVEFDHRTTAIIGQNGAGKTTFVKLLKGLLKPTTGSIQIAGRDTTKTTAAALAGTIGLVFQNPNDQIFKKNVLEEVMFGPENLKISKSEAEKQAKQALEMVGLLPYSQENPHDLGLADKKLLCIASVLAMNPAIVILDEPTIAQDHFGKQKISRLIRELQTSNHLVVTITHDMDFVADNFERTLVLNQGEMLLDDTTQAVFAATDIVKQAHVEPPYTTQLAHRIGMTPIPLTEAEFVNQLMPNK